MPLAGRSRDTAAKDRTPGDHQPIFRGSDRPVPGLAGIAQLAARTPLSGSSCQGASRPAHPKVGWGFGRLTFCCLAIAVVAVGIAPLITVAITGHCATGNLTSRGVTENAHGSFDVGGGPTAAMIMGLATPVGFDTAANLAEEAKDPYRGVPHAKWDRSWPPGCSSSPGMTGHHCRLHPCAGRR